MTIAERSEAYNGRSATRLLGIAVLGLTLGACSQTPELASGDQKLALAGATKEDRANMSTSDRSDLTKAINYWGRAFATKPTDKKAALNYAKNLKAAGQHKQALLVLQQASVLHGNDRELASEYGRLALGAGQIELSNKLLAIADDASQPDWRIVSARGAALAKLGKYGEAVKMFERANKLAPSNPSVLNNLAMAEAGNGNLKRAESLLRRASYSPMARAKVSKNLALVLRLQGRKAEAEVIEKGGGHDLRPMLPPAKPAGSNKVAQSPRA